MLKQLFIQNIILIDEATVPFDAGLNILTGETGAGKSAIMQSIALSLGEKGDSQIIRRGCDKGKVEALFESPPHEVITLLEEGGIEYEEGSPLIIKREIASSGKGRVFINNQASSLTFLKKIGAFLVKIVGQGESHALYNLDTHRSLIDLIGNLKPMVKNFQSHFEQENALAAKLKQLTEADSNRFREIDTISREIEEIDEAHIKEGEEDEIFHEFTLLSHAEEISKKLEEITEALSGERISTLASLRTQKHTLESIASFDPILQEAMTSYHNATLELQEVSHTLRNVQSRLHFDPERLQEIDARLSLLNKLKRKYGTTAAEIIDYRNKAKETLEKLQNRDIEIEEVKTQLKEIQKVTHTLALELSKNRKAVAQNFSHALTKQLRELNMAKAEFTTEVTGQKRGHEGDDRVEFFLSPNIGERSIPIKDGVSGGEISRVLLSLQTLIAGKENQGTLIFDEVDANIGGETATIVGNKLNEISQKHQVICITHFPQVAALAHYHLHISKEEKEGRTFTRVEALSDKNKVIELQRMAGHKVVNAPASL